MKKRGVVSSFFVRLLFSTQMALNGVTSNLLRTFLTVLGIAIGVAAVVALMGIGEGARRTVVAQFESLGENVIIIKSNFPEYDFDKEYADDLKERVVGVEYATPFLKVEKSKTNSSKLPIRWRRADGELEVIGVNQYYPKIRDHEVVSGNFFSSLHIVQRSPVCVLGYNIGISLLNGRSPVGQTIKIDGMNYRILGVMAPKGEGNGDGIDNKVIIPYTSGMKINGSKKINEIWAKSNSADDAELALVQIGRIIKRKINGSTIIANNSGSNPGMDPGLDPGMDPGLDPGMDPGLDPGMDPGLDPGMDPGFDPGMDPGLDPGMDPGLDPGMEEPEEEDPFDTKENLITVTSLNNLVEQADQANRIMSLLLGGIAAVSLLVGGIGIMNIMLVAVTERTSEIGVRRALGAKQEDLLIQFLLEAIFVSIIGCIVGIVIGALAVNLANTYGLVAVVSAQAVQIAVVVALASGLLFGVYPAINASSLPPVEALKRV